MEDVYKPIFSAWQEAAGEKIETQIMKKKWTVGGGQWAAWSHKSLRLFNLHCAICICHFAIKFMLTKHAQTTNTMTIKQHLSLFISYSPLKLPSGVFRPFRVPCLQSGPWFWKKPIRRMGLCFKEDLAC
jgi:hypothetical protein